MMFLRIFREGGLRGEGDQGTQWPGSPQMVYAALSFNNALSFNKVIVPR